MALSKRQTISYEIIDDQNPVLLNTYKGNWTHYALQGFQNNTVTATPNIGASFSLTFSGSQAYLYGGLLNSSDAEGDDFTVGWPTAEYTIDGAPAGAQMPHYDSDNSSVIYFFTPQLANGTHTINVNVTKANATDLFIIDYFLVVPTPGDTTGVQTTRAAPSSSSTVPITVSQATPVGAIVGGVVGGVAGIAILAIAAYYFLFRRARGGQAYYFDKPGAADVLSGEGDIEPFNAAPATPAAPSSHPPSSAGYSMPGPRSGYSDGSSTQPLNPAFRESGVTHVSGAPAQPRTGKAALIAQQHQNVEEPVQYQDSGMRFNGDVEQESGPSQLPKDVPPTYTPN